MTLDTESAIWDHLNTDAAIIALVGTFNGSPAVFSGQVPEQPDDVDPEFEAYVLVMSPYAMEDASTKTSPDISSAWESFKVLCAAPRKFSIVEVQLLETAVLERLNRAPIAPIGNHAFRDVHCLPGIDVSTQYELVRALDLTVWAQQTAL